MFLGRYDKALELFREAVKALEEGEPLNLVELSRALNSLAIVEQASDGLLDSNIVTVTLRLAGGWGGPTGSLGALNGVRTATTPEERSAAVRSMEVMVPLGIVDCTM